MPLFNDVEWFRGGPLIGNNASNFIPATDLMAVRRYRGMEENNREGNVRSRVNLSMTNPAYEYKHIGPAAEQAPPPPPPPPPADPVTIDEWMQGGHWPDGQRSVVLGNNHGGHCCGIRHIHRFWTGAHGENENSAPTVQNAQAVKAYIQGVQRHSDNDAGGPGIVEVCLTERQLEQRTFGWNWRDVLEHLDFIERYSFLNPNTDGRRVHVFHYCTNYEVND